MFQTILRNTQGGTAHHIFNRLFRQLGSAEEPFSKYEKNYKKPLHFRHRNVTNLWTYLMRLLLEKSAGVLHPPTSAFDHK